MLGMLLQVTMFGQLIKELLMKKSIIILLTLLAMAGEGVCATYYVSQDGTGAKDGSLAAPSDIATFNAGTAPYDNLDDDTVYLLDTITTAVAVPDAGTSGHVATIRGDYAGHACTIANTATAASFLIAAKSYISVIGISIAPSHATSNAIGLSMTGTVSGISLSNITINMTGASAAATYGAASSGANTNLVISGITVTGAKRQGIYVYGASSGSITVSDTDITGGYGFDFANVAGLTMSDCTMTNGTTSGKAYQIQATVTGLVALDNIAATSSSAVGIYFGAATLTAGSYIRNTTVTSAGSISFSLNGVTNLDIVNCHAVSGASHGFMVDDSTGVDLSLCSVSTLSLGRGYYILGTSSSVTLTDCTSAASHYSGFEVLETANNITFTRCTSTGSVSYGFNFLGTSNTITLLNCIAQTGSADGFSVAEGAHDITFWGCLSTGNGDKTSTVNGDGWGTHDNYNIWLYFCISKLNTATGYGMGQKSSGALYNCTAYGNGGNWSLEGGGKLDQVRGGLYFTMDDVNPTTSTSVIVKNYIGMNNYPCEVFGSATALGLATLTNNDYYPLDSTKLATINGGSTYVNWATYDASYETNSMSVDPKFKSAVTGDFTLTGSSPCINTGVDVYTGTASVTDYAGTLITNAAGVLVAPGGKVDIGTYEHKAKLNDAALKLIQ